MTTALITHTDCLKHVTPDGHPEQVARLEHVLAALEGKKLSRVEAPLAEESDLLRVHPQQHIDAIRGAAPKSGQVAMDADTFMSPGSLQAALRGVGGNVRAVDMVMSGEAHNAFVACRPPGHHAETSKPMGFCLFGNVAIAAKHALDHHGLNRVAIIDFDVHHGNGTQDLVQQDGRVLFASTHQSPLYPGTGSAHEKGAHGNVLNLPLPGGTGSVGFRAAINGRLLPAIDEFAPELILISAGFDAHRADPLAGMNLETSDFAWVTHKICDLADKHCQGRVVSTLEGGYDLEALAESAAAHVDVLIKRAKG